MTVDYLHEIAPAPAANAKALAVHCLDWRAAKAMQPAWEALTARVLEPNIYLEPAFALAATEHLAARARPRFLFVSAHDDGADAIRLIGVFPILPPRLLIRFVAGWLPKQAALGSPLLDRDEGAAALDLALQWMDRHVPGAAGVRWSLLEGDGPVASLIVERAKARGLATHRFDLGARAELVSGTDVENMLRRTMSRKHRKYRKLEHKRLEELGSLTYISARAPQEVQAAAKDFLAMEASGWKGRLGSALTSRQSSHAFARTMLEEQAVLGKCHIDTLAIDGRPIAMGVVLITGHEAFLWKIAFDEAYADYSPGVQFMLEFSQRQALDSDITITDSCAIPDHPMFNHIWTDKMPISDIFVSLSRGRETVFRASIAVETARRSIRELLKRVYYKISRRRRT